MKLTVPSERNFEIYHAVDTQGMSRREAAVKYDLSPTRVQQIVEQVRYYIAQFGSDDLMFLPPQLAELASLRINYERLRFLYGHLMRAWQQSQAGIPLPEADAPTSPAVATVLPPPGGNLRLVQQAVRIAVQQTKVAGRMAQVQYQLATFNMLPNQEPIDAVEQAGDDDDLAFPPLSQPLPIVSQGAVMTEPPTRGCTEAASPPTAQPLPEASERRITFDPEAVLADLNKALDRRRAKQRREQRSAQRGSRSQV